MKLRTGEFELQTEKGCQMLKDISMPQFLSFLGSQPSNTYTDCIYCFCTFHGLAVSVLSPGGASIPSHRRVLVTD